MLVNGWFSRALEYALLYQAWVSTVVVVLVQETPLCAANGRLHDHLAQDGHW
jgi:hypothetical protein